MTRTLAALWVVWPCVVAAQGAPGEPPGPVMEPMPPPPAAPPAAYAMPWQLRPAAVGNVVRLDTALASYQDSTDERGNTVASLLFASYKVLPELAPFARVGMVRNSPPAGDGAVSWVNPAAGATYAVTLPAPWRLSFLLGFAFPLGMGGGNQPDLAKATANAAGVRARSAMDNAMFAVNDFTVFPGVDFAYVSRGLTVQVEATVLQLTRQRGADVQKDSAKTNSTCGLFVGYFLLPELSAGAELRYQRWLSTPAFLEGADALRDTLTAAAGLRAHLKLGDTLWLRPGIAYARGLDDPMAEADYQIVQVDLPLAF